MKILFKVSGSKLIGFGHIRRSLTLATEIQKKYSKIKIIFFIETKKNFYLQKLFKDFKVHWEGKNSSLIEVIKDKEIKIIIIDEQKNNFSEIKKIKSSTNIFLVALDYYFKNTLIDLNINLFNHNSKSTQGNKNLFHNLKFGIIRKTFSSNNKKINKIKKIIISFGGGDKKNNSLKVLKWLNINIKDKITIYITKKIYDVNAVNLKLLKNLDISYLKKYSSFDKKINECDMMFCGGGTTLLESCYCGIPTIVLPQSKKEEKFAKFFEKKGAIILVSNLIMNNLKLRNFYYNKQIKRSMSKIQKKIIDGKGVERITKLIFENFMTYEKNRKN